MGTREENEYSQIFIANITRDREAIIAVKSEFTIHDLLFADELSWSASPPAAKTITHGDQWVDLGRGSLFARSYFGRLQVVEHTHQREDVLRRGSGWFYHNSFVAPSGERGSAHKKEHLFHLIVPDFAAITELSFGSSAANILVATLEVSFVVLMFRHLELDVRFGKHPNLTSVSFEARPN